MLPAFIIERIRRDEQARVRKEIQPFLELPLPEPIPLEQEPEDYNRGVITIDLM